jgi:hypothetical protein
VLDNFNFIEREIIQSGLIIGDEQYDLIYENACFEPPCFDVLHFGIHTTSLEIRSTSHTLAQNVDTERWGAVEKNGLYLEDLLV